MELGGMVPPAATSQINNLVEKAHTNRKYIIILAFLFNLYITYAIGVSGRSGGETNEYLSLKYQTLITPAGWAFSIWGVIFLAQAGYVVAQALPEYETHTLVMEGVRNDYIGTCVAQIIWTISFSHEYIGLSFIAMVAICYFLINILKSQYALGSEENTWKHYGLLRFPFELHAGWIIAALFVNFSVWLVSLNAFSIILVTVAALTLVGIFAVAAGSLWYILKPNFIIPFVMAWATVSFLVRSGIEKPIFSFRAAKPLS